MPSGPSGSGPFRLDARAKVLLRDGEPVLLSPRQFDVLHELVVNAGRIVSKNRLIEVAWHGEAVSDSNLEKIVAQVRERLDAAALNRHIETAPRRGYRFIGPHVDIDSGPTEAELDAQLAPLRALLDGRAAIETLGCAQIAEARERFERLAVRHSRHAGVHVALANACILQYESTRADPEPDAAALQCAVEHARTARQLDPGSGEAWATLGFVIARTGAQDEAVAALRQATELEPDNWRHSFRLSTISWGEARLRAARRTLARLPHWRLARLVVAILFVARDTLADAEQELDAGLAVMPGEGTATSGFSPVALHWLKGLLCLARGAEEEALAAFARELALEPRGHLYARECCANTWYAIGACRLRRGDHAAARAAFEQTLARVPRHPMAHVGMRLLTGDRGADGSSRAPITIEIAIARAACLVADGDAPAAARVVSLALAAAPPGNAGWLVPIEPLLGVQRDRPAWAAVLAALMERAI